MFTRRHLIQGVGAAGLLLATGAPVFGQEGASGGLTDMAAGAVPIGAEEHLARIAKAQALMQAQGISGLLIEAGSALVYFTGVRWWRSERFTGVIIPAEGEPVVVTLHRVFVRLRPKAGPGARWPMPV